MNVIREVRKEDLEDVLVLYQQLFLKEDYSDSYKYIDTWNEILLDKKMTCLISYLDNIPVATCVIFIPNLSRNQRPYAIIENVITSITYRKQGLGKAIIDKAVEITTNSNCYKVMLLSSSIRIEAHRFYEKIGFNGNSKKGFQLRIS